MQSDAGAANDAAMRFAGIIPPICTPLEPEGPVDAPSLERLVGRLLEAGVHGIFALGSTGEAIYLDDALRRRVVEIVHGTVAGAVPVLVGALDATPARVIDQVRLIEHCPIDAIVVTAPYYANTSDAETTRHFELVAAATAKPVLAYDIPGNVGRKLPTAVAVDLLAREVIAGLKDSSGSMDGFAAVLAAVGPNRLCSILTGSDVCAADCLAAGADGIVPGIGNVAPELLVELYQAHCEGDQTGVRKAQTRITALAALFDIGRKYGVGLHASQIGALKVALRHDGIITSETLSSPLSRYPAEPESELIILLDTSER